ncbi:hypothetical protein [Clostridium butyricum]
MKNVRIKKLLFDKHDKYEAKKCTIKEYVESNSKYENKEYIGEEMERTKIVIENKKSPYLSCLLAIVFAILPNIVSAFIDINDETNINGTDTNLFRGVMIFYLIIVCYSFMYYLVRKEEDFLIYNIYLKVLEDKYNKILMNCQYNKEEIILNEILDKCNRIECGIEDLQNKVDNILRRN